METFFPRKCVFCDAWFKSYYVVWKLHKTDNKNITHAKFKSYYVVWKQFWGYIPPSFSVSLNRTMQYGNFSLFRKPPHHTAFKSYYVVWKLQCAYIDFPIFLPFKSYYVVWKLNDINTKDTVERQFKSYYVVWKPALAACVAAACIDV